MEVAPRLFAWHDAPAWSPPPLFVCCDQSMFVSVHVYSCTYLRNMNMILQLGRSPIWRRLGKRCSTVAPFSSTHRWIDGQYSVQIKSPFMSSTQLPPFNDTLELFLSLWLSDVATTYVLWHMTSWIIDWNDVQNKPKATLPLLQLNQTICCYFRSAFGYLADSHLYREHVWWACCR